MDFAVGAIPEVATSAPLTSIIDLAQGCQVFHASLFGVLLYLEANTDLATPAAREEPVARALVTDDFGFDKTYMSPNPFLFLEGGQEPALATQNYNLPPHVTSSALPAHQTRYLFPIRTANPKA